MDGQQIAAQSWQPHPPPALPRRAGWVGRWRRARRNILAALPRRLFRAWMAELRTPFFASFVVNEPAFVDRVLVGECAAFPKHRFYRRVLGDLLGDSAFSTTARAWQRQRRIIDPAFGGGRLREAFPSMCVAIEAMSRRLEAHSGQAINIEAEASHAAADVIFRTLFSVPIQEQSAAEIFVAFRCYQEAAPMLSTTDLLGLGRGLRFASPRRRAQAQAANSIRQLLGQMITRRVEEIDEGHAPDDLATALLTGCDPENGRRLGAAEAADQIALFFMAGHETSAAAISWALYLVAGRLDIQERLRAEADAVIGDRAPEFCDLRRLSLARDVFRETLRLYPPIPMMVRSAACPTVMRGREIPVGSIVIVSPWHLGRHERLWERPHEFDPDRWRGAGSLPRGAFLPFSAGPRACPGAGFAMQEGTVFLAEIVRRFDLRQVSEHPPEPMAQLTLRSRNGIWLALSPRGSAPGT